MGVLARQIFHSQFAALLESKERLTEKAALMQLNPNDPENV